MIRIPFADAQKELPLADRGTYDLVIRQFKRNVSQKGVVWFSVSFAFEDGKHPSFRQTFFCPGPDDRDPEERVRQFVRLLKMFDIPFDEDMSMDEFEPKEDDCVGATASATVFIGTDKDEDQQEFEVNRIALGAPRKYKGKKRDDDD